MSLLELDPAHQSGAVKKVEEISATGDLSLSVEGQYTDAAQNISKDHITHPDVAPLPNAGPVKIIGQ